MRSGGSFDSFASGISRMAILSPSRISTWILREPGTAPVVTFGASFLSWMFICVSRID